MEFGFTWAALLNLDHFHLAISNKGSMGDAWPQPPPCPSSPAAYDPRERTRPVTLSAKASLGNSATSSKVKG